MFDWSKLGQTFRVQKMSERDLTYIEDHVTCKGHSLLLGIVHYSTTWSYKQARTCLIGQKLGQTFRVQKISERGRGA